MARDMPSSARAKTGVIAARRVSSFAAATSAKEDTSSPDRPGIEGEGDDQEDERMMLLSFQA